MKTLIANYKIQTPMFLGDEKGSCPSEIRPTAFKGALRFWWRALQWSKMISRHNSIKDALKALHKEEAELFGISAQADGSGGQGKVLVTTASTNLNLIDYKTASKNKTFLAYGMQGDSKKKASAREAIEANQTFTAKLIAKPSTSDTQLESIQDALIFLGLLGSLGAKARNGFGSLSIVDYKIGDKKYDFEFNSIADYEAEIQKITKKYKLDAIEQLPPFTAFSSRTEVGYSYEDFAYIAKKYKEFIEENENNKDKEFFGLPRKGYGQNARERRASPLMIHIHNIAGKEMPVLLLMPALWNPQRRDSDTSFEQFKLPKMWVTENTQKRIEL